MERAGYSFSDVSSTHAHVPGWIARCRSALHVASALRWAQQRDLPARAVGSGHSDRVSTLPKRRADTRDMQRLLWFRTITPSSSPDCEAESNIASCRVRNLMSLRVLEDHAARGWTLPSLPCSRDKQWAAPSGLPATEALRPRNDDVAL